MRNRRQSKNLLPLRLLDIGYCGIMWWGGDSWRSALRLFEPEHEDSDMELSQMLAYPKDINLEDWRLQTFAQCRNLLEGNF
jgi:hypothetical protein